MTDYQKLYTGIGRAAWGYFFIYFDFNINTVSILPSFIGYMLFLSAINCLCEEERELNLLRTLGVTSHSSSRGRRPARQSALRHPPGRRAQSS